MLTRVPTEMGPAAPALVHAATTRMVPSGSYRAIHTW